MERSHLFELMSELKLYGMKAAFDEIMATAVVAGGVNPQNCGGDSARRARTSRLRQV